MHTRNVELPLIYAGIPRKKRHERVRELLSLVGLEDRWCHRPCQLSGASNNALLLHALLPNRPALILADEPTGALDSQSSTAIMEVLQSLSQQGMTVVLITHEPHIAGYADRTVALRDGKIFTDGKQMVEAA